MKLFKYAVIASAVLATQTATAATDGTLGATSTGTSIVTIIKDNAVQITKVEDINLGTFSSIATGSTVTEGDNVCVFNSTGAYRLTVTSANGAFALKNGAATADTMNYSVSWAVGTGAATNVTYNTQIAGLAGDQTDPTCGGAAATNTNARFEVSVDAAAFNAAPPGTYTDTLTLLVEPQ